MSETFTHAFLGNECYEIGEDGTWTLVGINPVIQLNANGGALLVDDESEQGSTV